MKKILHHSFCNFMLLLIATLLINTAGAQVTHTESFDGTTFLPTGWTAVGTITAWSRNTTGGQPTCTPHSGPAMARFSRNAAPGTLQTFASPSLDYSFRGIDTPRVSFWIYRDGGAPTVNDIVTIFVNTSPSLTGASAIGTVARSRVIQLPDTQIANGWYQYIFDIPASYNTSTNYFLVRGANDVTPGNNIYLDDFQYDEYPTPCSGTPTAGTITANDSTLCGGTGATTLRLNGQATQTGISFQWYYGSSVSGPWTTFGTSVTSLSTGTITATTYYYCQLTCSNSGLSASTPVIHVAVDPNPAPVVNVTASNNSNYCTGVPNVLVATGALAYSWSPAASLNQTTGDTVLASVAGAPGTSLLFTVVGTNAAGCAAIDTIRITAHSTPNITIQVTPNDTVCSGQQVTLHTAQTGGGPGTAPVTNWLWTPGGDTTQDISFFPGLDSTYVVVASNTFGCAKSDSVHIHVAAGAIPVLTSVTASHNGLYCTGQDSVILTAVGTGGISYTWSPNNGLSSTSGSTVSAAPVGGGGPGGGSTLYTVVLTNAAGCAASDTIRVRRSNPPFINIQSTPGDSICAGTSDTLFANVTFPGDTFLWSPTGDTSQTIVVSPGANTTYICHVISAFSGCPNADTVNIAVFPAPTASFTFSASGPIATFTNNSVNGASYFWNFGDSSTSAQQSPPPHFYVSSNTYNVMLVVTNGSCTDTIIHPVTIVVGINEISNGTVISILPNPAVNTTTVQFNAEQTKAELQVVNAIGQVVQEKMISQKGNKGFKEEINLIGLPSGLYMIRINAGTKSFSRRLIKM